MPGLRLSGAFNTKRATHAASVPVVVFSPHHAGAADVPREEPPVLPAGEELPVVGGAPGDRPDAPLLGDENTHRGRMSKSLGVNDFLRGTKDKPHG